MTTYAQGYIVYATIPLLYCVNGVGLSVVIIRRVLVTFNDILLCHNWGYPNPGPQTFSNASE